MLNQWYFLVGTWCGVFFSIGVGAVLRQARWRRYEKCLLDNISRRCFAVTHAEARRENGCYGCGNDHFFGKRSQVSLD